MFLPQFRVGHQAWVVLASDQLTKNEFGWFLILEHAMIPEKPVLDVRVSPRVEDEGPMQNLPCSPST